MTVRLCRTANRPASDNNAFRGFRVSTSSLAPSPPHVCHGTARRAIFWGYATERHIMQTSSNLS